MKLTALPIRHTLPLMVFGVFLLFSGFMLFVTLQTHHDDITRSTMTRGEAAAARLVRLAEDHLMNLPQEVRREIVLLPVTWKNISGIAVVKPNGSVHFAHRTDWIGRPLANFSALSLRSATSGAQRLWHDGGRKFSLLVPFDWPRVKGGVDEYQRGYIFIEIDAGPDFDRVLQANLSKLLTILGAGLMLALGLYLWLRHSLIRPLRSLTHSARRIGHGEFVGIPELKAGLELETLASEFEAMQHRLQKQEASLHSAQQALAVSEEKYRLLADNLTDLVLWIDPQGRYIYASHASMAMTGYSAAELLEDQSLFARIVHLDDRTLFKHHIPSLDAAGQRELELRIVRADGAVRWIAHHCQPIHNANGQFLGRISVNRDITERKQAELTLRENEQSFRLLNEQIPAIVYRAAFTELSETIYISPRIAELGYTPEEWLADQNIWTDSIHPDDKETVFRQLETLHRTGGKLAIEYRMRHRNGEWRDYRDIGEILRDGDGNPLYLQGVMLDITDKKREELALRDALSAAQHLREALDQVQAYVFMKDRESRYFYANRQMLELLGCSQLDIVGKPDASFFPPETVERLRAIDQRVLAGESTAEEIEVERPDGVRRIYWEVKSPIYLDDTHKEVWGISGISTDITAHKLLEETLSFQNRRSQFLLELPQLADQLDEADFMQRGLEMAEILTSSQISFIHFVNPDQDTIELVTWSRRTLESYCQAAFDRHYPISQAGIWAEALRQKQPVVFNDYASAPSKHGLPEGHAALDRLISLPVIEEGKVMMLAGVGNKPQIYTQDDTETLQLIANEIWRLVQRRRNRDKIEHFSRMIERSLNEIFTFDSVTLKFVDANRGACANTGYSIEELRNMTPVDIKPLMTPESFALLIEPLRTGAEKIVHFTTTHRRKDGTEYQAELHIELTDDAHPLFIAVARDITERLQLEQTVRQLAQAVEQSPESIAIADLDANLAYVNAAFVRNTGYNRAEILGQNPRILKSGKTPVTTYMAMWDALVHGRPWQGELINKRKDGSEYTEWARISPIRQPDGRITHYLAIKEDITERKRADQELRQALQIVEASSIVHFRVSANAAWSVEYVSPNIARWGYDPKNFTDGRLNFTNLVHPDDIERIGNEIMRLPASEEAITLEYRMRHKNGTPFWVEDHTRIVRDAAGELHHYECVISDIEIKKRYEQELSANLNDQKALNKKLEAAQNQLLQSEKMASIGQLAAGVAHELNNPIGFVNSNLGTLDNYLRDLFAILNAYAEAEQVAGPQCPQLEHVHTMKHDLDYDFLRNDIYQLMTESKDGLARVAKIVRDLKDFSRAGDTAMQWANLHQGLDSTLNIVWNELKYKCTVTKHYGELPQVWCEPSQLNQVFMNLLVNASHAIPDKGEITITTGKRHGAGDEEVFVAIADTGTGIAPENLSRVFDPFFTTKPVGKGTGLGLSLAYSIVQKHRGRIEVVSTVGKGSTFTVWLPINPPKADDAVTQVLTLEPS